MSTKNENFKKDSKLREIKSILYELGVSSTSHGLPNFLRAEKLFFKLMWLFFMLLSVGYCAYILINSIGSFLSFEVVTNINVIQEIPAKFPVVTICNQNPYFTNFSQNFIQNMINEKNLTSSFSSKSLNEFIIRSFMLRYMVQANAMSSLSDAQLKNFSLPLKESLISCFFGMDACSEDDFDWYFDMFYGNCYSFNYNQIRNSTQAGFMNGLRLEFYVGNPSYINEFLQSYGLHVYVHNQTVKLRSLEGVDVSSGKRTSIVINRAFVSKLEYPFDDCRSKLNTLDDFNSDFYRIIIKSNKTYTQNACFDICLQDYIIKNCKCHNAFFENWTSSVPCVNLDQVMCVLIWTDSFFKSYLVDNCKRHCPLECDTVTYSMSLSDSVYPSPKYAGFLMRQEAIRSKFQDASELEKGLVAINVYYEDLKYTYVSQLEKMGFEDLISNLGGTLGLFIGISFLSFVEIFEAILQVIFILAQREKNEQATIITPFS